VSSKDRTRGRFTPGGIGRDAVSNDWYRACPCMGNCMPADCRRCGGRKPCWEALAVCKKEAVGWLTVIGPALLTRLDPDAVGGNWVVLDAG
jgi:hypothetical protein